MAKPKELAKLKEKLISKRRELLTAKVDSIQRKILSKLIDRIIARLDTEGKNIVNTTDNVNITTEVDKIFRDFEKDVAAIMNTVKADYATILKKNLEYFATSVVSLTKKVETAVEKKMQLRIGLKPNGDVIKDGFIDSITSNRNIAQKTKQAVLTAVLNGAPLGTLTKTLTNYIGGTEQKDGAIQNQFKTFVYDTYSQFDAETSNAFANELSLNYAIYEGGIVDGTRPFCAERNGNVFTREEVEAFGTPRDKFGGYINKALGKFAGKNDNYIPERDRGGYNCGHYYNWVSYNIAKSLRPDISKSKYDTIPNPAVK